MTDKQTNQVFVSHLKGKVHIEMNEPVKWIEMSPDTALKFAQQITDHAQEAGTVVAPTVP